MEVNTPSSSPSPSESMTIGGEEEVKFEEQSKSGTEIILVEFEENDPEDPRNWCLRTKWIQSMAGIFFCGAVSICVSGYSIALGSVVEEYGLQNNKLLAVLGITLFTITFGAAPLILSPLSEVFGRALIYKISALIYSILFIPQALSPNITGILVSRLLSGVAGSTAVSLVGGTLADLWDNDDRAFPMALFAFFAFATTGFGPVVFGAVEQKYGFRIISWILFASSFLFFLVLLFGLKETRASVLLKRKAIRLRLETGDERYVSKSEVEERKITFAQNMQINLTRPIRMLVTEPILISFSVWISVAWGILYIALAGIPFVFGGVYGFDITQSGLVFNAQIIGSVAGLFVNWYCQRLYVKHSAVHGPEARLFTAMFGGVLSSIGCWIYAWTANPSIHWVVPAFGMSILYCGLLLIYLCIFTYLGDIYTLYAASALSAQSFLRNTTGALCPLFTDKMYNSIGIAYAGTIPAVLSTILAITPFILFRYGSILRARSPFAKYMIELEAAEAESKLEKEQKSAIVEKKEIA